MTSVLKFVLRFTSNKKTIVNRVTEFCKLFHIQESDICETIVPLNADMIIDVARNITLDGHDVCGILFGDKCGYSKVRWEVTIPSIPPKPSPTAVRPPPPGSPLKRVLHVSDTHIDFEYTPGANAECKRPLCCRKSDGMAKTKNEGAGYWGDNRKCDTPSWTFESMLSTLKQQEREYGKFDYILWTGDIPPHDVWNQTKSDQLESIQRVVDLITKTFPDTPIFPSLGNHESSPVNSYPPRNYDGKHSMDWLYGPLEKNWSRWLPKGYSPSTIKRGAFYSTLLEPGFRIISLNMNYCNNHNFWLLLNLTDPLGQLEWLVDELFKAEAAEEKVHILGHIPPGIPDCLKSWSHNYYRIIDRFESTVTGQFFGHTHYDEIEMFYSLPDLKRPTNVAYVAPSVTTFENLNPGFRVYMVDGDRHGSTRYVIDSFTYFLNITKANLENKPVWELEYSARGAYNMTSLFPADWSDFAHRMIDNDTLLELYVKYFYKSYEKHDNDLVDDIICRFVSGRSDDPHLCEDIINQFHANQQKRQRRDSKTLQRSNEDSRKRVPSLC